MVHIAGAASLTKKHSPKTTGPDRTWKHSRPGHVIVRIRLIITGTQDWIVVRPGVLAGQYRLLDRISLREGGVLYAKVA